MKQGKIVAGIVVMLAVVAVLLAVTGKMSVAQSEGKDAGDAAKIEEVLKGQQEIMKSLSDIKEELKIIKIRVTQMQ